LIELMIVVAIIGILAAIAIPIYQDNAIRAKMTEVILAGANCRTAITLDVQSSNFPPGSGNWGCESSGVGGSTKYVSQLQTFSTNGASTPVRIVITAQNISPAVNTFAVQYRACRNTDATSAGNCTDIVMGGTVGTWLCGPHTAALKPKYLPHSCRAVLF
jgi:type IV pilus assembly protein PilA